MKTSMKYFMAAIAGIGVLRFVLTIAGLPNSLVRFASMTVIITVGAVYFAFTSTTHKERLKAAYLLLLPYMIVEVAALGYTWATGHQTIFHAEEYSLGFGIAQHTLGHLVGGVTWEPLSVFVIMEILWLISIGVRRLRPGSSFVDPL
jgi:hypothetical protein